MQNSSWQTYVAQNFTWEQLPVNVKHALQNQPTLYRDVVVQYSWERQLRWDNNVVRTVISEEDYYDGLVKYLRANLLVFPYHLSDVLNQQLRLPEFQYYLGMMADVFKSEKSYDVIPNFTAADCVRLLGVGRNQFIDKMNHFRSKGWMRKVRKAMVYDELPSCVVDSYIDYWWLVRIGHISSSTHEKLTPAQADLVKLIYDAMPTGIVAYRLSLPVLRELYKKGVLYFHLPIELSDFITVPPLQGFVMNRVGGDPFEKLLYDIFVSFEERKDVQALVHTLQVSPDLVQNALSFYCRLGFARKKNVEPLSELQCDPSWLTDEFKSRSTYSGQDGDQLLPPDPEPTSCLSEPVDSQLAAALSSNIDGKRIGVLFDSTLTAFLMMGNLSQGLKNHAVTMFEVGKLPDETMPSFLAELDQVNDISEGDAARYFAHAVTLRNTLRFLRHNEECAVPDSDGGVDLLRCESINGLDPSIRLRMLSNNYALLVSMAPLTAEPLKMTSCKPTHFGPCIPEVSSAWFKLYLYQCAGAGPPSILLRRGTRLARTPSILRGCAKVLVSSWSNHAEPAVVHQENLLTHLNELLLSSPVLAQVYCYEFEEPTTVEVVFPFAKEGEDEEAAVNPEELALKDLPCVQQLYTSLCLSRSCGYVKLLRLSPPDTPGDHLWVPLDIHFGIPMADVATNSAVCRRIRTHALFSADNLLAHALLTKRLSIKLLDFIAHHRGIDLELDNEQIPFPSNHVQFDDGCLKHVVGV